MVIHSSPGSRRKRKALREIQKNVAPVVPEKKVVIEEPKVEIPVIDDPTAEEFIATLPKKPSKKKVTKPIEEE